MEPINPFTPAFKRSPYPGYAKMREEAPVLKVLRPGGPAIWLITRYDDVVSVLRDPRFKKDYRSVVEPEERAIWRALPPIEAALTRHMLASDPPDHTRMRNLVVKAFAPRLIAQQRERIQALADSLIDAVFSRGEMDLIDDYAFPLPITVIAELMGVPVADRDRFREWSSAVVTDRTAPGALEALAVAGKAFVAYLRDLFEERRKNPRADLITALVEAEEAGDRLDETELVSTVFLLLVAGHETTVNLIGNGMLALLTRPDELKRLRDEPALLVPAVEELLRFDGPVETSTFRFAAEAVELAGVTIPRGAPVLVVLGSANRDATRFSDADQLILDRRDNDHLAFGHGIHYCLGASLARLEGQIAIGTLLRRLPSLRLAVPVEELEWRPSLLIRGMVRCPVRFS
jgi:cytochrome P450 PksS